MTDHPRLILASSSPGRAMIFRRLGLAFTVVPGSVDEEAHPEISPPKRAQQLATLKARDVAGRHPDAYVIGCDSVVEARGQLLEKPRDAEDAARMLRVLSGQTAQCHSGMCIVHGERMARGLCTTSVTFADLRPEMIDWWIAHGGWKGCAGAFQIEGKAQLLISKIEGDFTSVVGLPVYLLGALLQELQFPLWEGHLWPKDAANDTA